MQSVWFDGEDYMGAAWTVWDWPQLRIFRVVIDLRMFWTAVFPAASANRELIVWRPFQSRITSTRLLDMSRSVSSPMDRMGPVVELPRSSSARPTVPIELRLITMACWSMGNRSRFETFFKKHAELYSW